MRLLEMTASSHHAREQNTVVKIEKRHGLKKSRGQFSIILTKCCSVVKITHKHNNRYIEKTHNCTTRSLKNSEECVVGT